MKPTQVALVMVFLGALLASCASTTGRNSPAKVTTKLEDLIIDGKAKIHREEATRRKAELARKQKMRALRLRMEQANRETKMRARIEIESKQKLAREPSLLRKQEIARKAELQLLREQLAEIRREEGEKRQIKQEVPSNLLSRLKWEELRKAELRHLRKMRKLESPRYREARLVEIHVGEDPCGGFGVCFSARAFGPR